MRKKKKKGKDYLFHGNDRGGCENEKIEIEIAAHPADVRNQK